MSNKGARQGSKHKKAKAPQQVVARVKVNVAASGGGTSPGVPLEQQTAPSATPGMLLEQQRAAYALRWLQQASTQADVKQGELKTYTRRLPGMIQMNGFGQAMAFYYAKRSKSRAYEEVYRLVEGWLCDGAGYQRATGKSLYAGQVGAGSPGRLLHALTSEGQGVYRHAQAETQALLRWAKKFAESLVDDETVQE